MHLINDPQALAELLFGKLQVGHMSYDTKMLVILVMCRIIGMHQLIMLNVYPFLQRYIQPSQLEVRARFIEIPTTNSLANDDKNSRLWAFAT